MVLAVLAAAAISGCTHAPGGTRQSLAQLRADPALSVHLPAGSRRLSQVETAAHTSSVDGHREPDAITVTYRIRVPPQAALTAVGRELVTLHWTEHPVASGLDDLAADSWRRGDRAVLASVRASGTDRHVLVLVLTESFVTAA
jgi:hypothetical protein